MRLSTGLGVYSDPPDVTASARPSPSPPSVYQAFHRSDPTAPPSSLLAASANSQTSATAAFLAAPPGRSRLVRKRSLAEMTNDNALVVASGPPPPPAAQTPASLKCVLPGLKRLRRDSPASPTSVGDVSDPKAVPVAAPAAMTSAVATAAAATASPASAKMQSMLRGLQHVATCGADGCANPLCVSTRNFVAKVQAHQSAAAAKPGHDSARCGACQLWVGILRAHAPACGAHRCCVPGCSQQKAAAVRVAARQPA